MFDFVQVRKRERERQRQREKERERESVCVCVLHCWIAATYDERNLMEKFKN